MGKITIELDLDWINEDGSLQSSIKDEVINNLQSRFVQKAELNLDKMMNAKLEEVASKVTDEFLEKLLSEKVENLQIPFKKDSWGSTYEYVPISEFVGKKYEQFLTKKVLDNDGNEVRNGRDGTTSINEYFINKYLQKELVTKVNNLIKNARQDAEVTIIKTLEENLKSQLSADIINRLNIPSMLKGLQEKAALFEGENK